MKIFMAGYKKGKKKKKVEEIEYKIKYGENEYRNIKREEMVKD